MENVQDVVKHVKKVVAEELDMKYGKEERQERMLYAIPYDIMPITSPHSNSNEVALTLDDVILVIKQKILEDGSINRIFEVYNTDAKRIIESDIDGRMKFDKEIIDELLKNKIKIITEAGFNAAGVTIDGDKIQIESYFEMLGRKLVIMNDEQKAKLDKSEDRIKTLSEISKENIDPEESHEYNEIENKDANTKMAKLARDTGIEVSSMVKIDDGIFYENNPEITSRSAYAVLTRTGDLKIAGYKNGKFVELDCFENSSNQAGRTDIIRADDKKIDTKNTYGAIIPKSHPNMRYTIELGVYGEPKLIEQIRYQGNVMEESDKYISREVQTNNTNYADRNLEGDENSKNVTARTFQQSRGYTEGTYYGNLENAGGIKDVGEALNEDPIDFTMEATATDINQRVDNAIKLINEEFYNREIELSTEDEEKIRAKLEEQLNQPNEIFGEQDAREFCDKYLAEKEEEKRKNEGPERLSPAEAARRKRFGF